MRPSAPPFTPPAQLLAAAPAAAPKERTHEIVKVRRLHATAATAPVPMPRSPPTRPVGWAEFYDGFSGATLAPLVLAFGGSPPAWTPPVRAHQRVAARHHAGGCRRHLAPGPGWRSKNACLTSPGRPRACPCTSCSAARSATASGHTGRIAAGYRVRHAALYEKLGYAPVRTLGRLTRLGREAVRRASWLRQDHSGLLRQGSALHFNGGSARRRLSRPQHQRRHLRPSSTSLARCGTASVRTPPDARRGASAQRPEGYCALARRLDALTCTGWNWTSATPRRWPGSQPHQHAHRSLKAARPARIPAVPVRRTVDTPSIDPMWTAVWHVGTHRPPWRIAFGPTSRRTTRWASWAT